MDNITDKEFRTLLDTELFSAILDTMAEAIWIIDFNKPYPYWFASIENKLKYAVPQDPISPNFWSDNVHPEDTQRAVSAFRQALENPEISFFVHEYRFAGADRQYFTIHDRIRFLRDDAGKAFRVIGSWRDVTQERLREQRLEQLFDALEEERNRFKAIAELSNTAMWELDFATGALQWMAGNITLEEFGFNTPEYSVQNWIQGIHEEDRERVVMNFDRAVATEDKFFDSYRFLKKDGSIVHVIDQGNILRDADRKAVKAIGSWLDITRERKREEVLERTLEQQRSLNHELQVREEELASTEEELRQINDQLSLHVQQLSEREFILNQSQKLAKIASWEYDPMAKKMFWSNEMYNIYGVDHTFDVNNFSEIQQLYDESSSKLVTEAFQSMLTNRNLPFDITVQVKTPLGYKKWARITAHPVIEEGHMLRILGLTYDITYFKEAEERLKTSEEKFSKAFRFSPDLMSIHRDSDSVIVDVNDNVFPILGYKREEVVGRPASDLNLFENTEDKVRFYEIFNKEGHATVETRWRKKDGTVVDVQISSNSIEFEGDRYLLNVVQDISKRKSAEERFIKAFDLSPDLMLVFREKDQVLIDVNSKLELISGYVREDVIGRSSHDIQLWTDQEHRSRYFKEYAANGSVSTEAFFQGKTRKFYGAISAQRIVISGENHMLVVVRDITERRQAEERIAQSEANLNAVINNTHLLVWSWDRQLKLSAFNEPFRKHIKKAYGRDIYIGRDFLDNSLDSEAITSLKTRWNEWQTRALRGESFREEQERMGRFWQFSISPIIGNDYITGVTVFGEDITDRRSAEAQIIENEARLDAIINNTDMAIWSVNLDFCITAANNIFNDLINVGKSDSLFKAGDNVLEASSKILTAEEVEYWRILYTRAFSGESLLDELEVNGRSLLASIHPIIENKRIIGASVYMQDITDRKQKEEDFNRKTLELAEANKKIGSLKLMALRSVMNPHFIFNALNSIQYFIAKNDRQNAINYLSTFSKLVRGVLTHSVNDKISIADELDLLKYYINLEMVRFENKFEFALDVDPELDVENVEIPSLLIQPYVENAILHGLYNKLDKGLLKITVRYDKDKVLFIVEDDGIGRQAAQVIKEKNFPKHTSMGTVLTEERLRLINELNNVSFEMVDLHHADGTAAGTRVNIWVRF